MTSFSYALVMMHAMLYIRVQDTGGHERLLTPEPLQRCKENRTSYCAQRHERRYQRVFVTVKMQGLVHTNGGTEINDWSTPERIPQNAANIPNVWTNTDGDTPRGTLSF